MFSLKKKVNTSDLRIVNVILKDLLTLRPYRYQPTTCCQLLSCRLPLLWPLPSCFIPRRRSQKLLLMMSRSWKKGTFMLLVCHQARTGQIQAGGWGGPGTPFCGTPKLHKEGKKRCAHVRENATFQYLTVTWNPTPLSKILYLPL